jgi:arylsulfatase A-like enzyme
MNFERMAEITPRGSATTTLVMLGLLLTGLLQVSSQHADQPLEAKRPNVLFILVDDLGVHDLGFTGSKVYETPNIDKLGREAAHFTQGYAAGRVCSPARASILTGKFTARHGITDWIGARQGIEWREMQRFDRLLPASYAQQLPHEDTTLAEALKSAGYRTFFAGKWHLGGEGSYPEDHGFEKNVGGWHAGSPAGGFFSPWGNPRLVNREDGENLSLRLARETADFMKANRDGPFFAFLSFYAVHAPLQTTREKWSKYREKIVQMGVPENGFKMERILPIRQAQDNPVYAGLVESTDDAVGEVLKALTELELEDNTIVIFTSDNGGVASGDHYSTSNLPLRGGKGYQWEGGIRVPIFIKVPWLGRAGKHIDFPVTGTDFFPTILDLADVGLMPAQHVDGVSLAPLLRNQSAELPARALFWHYPHYGNQGGEPSSIIRDKNWKLIHYWEGGRNELYDLSSDTHERSDLSEDLPRVTAQLAARLSSWLTEVDASLPEIDTQYDPQQARARRDMIVNELFPALENEREEMLSADFNPGQGWWGSEPATD